jgi:hypothetical protein
MDNTLNFILNVTFPFILDVMAVLYYVRLMVGFANVRLLGYVRFAQWTTAHTPVTEEVGLEEGFPSVGLS